MRIEQVEVPHDEWKSGKWQSTQQSSDKYTVTIVYNDDGSINERSTYSLEYRKKHHLGEFRKNDDEVQAKLDRNKAKKEGGGSSGCCSCCSICKCIWKILKCLSA